MVATRPASRKTELEEGRADKARSFVAEMAFVVPDHIAFCQVHGRTALLDIREDRYSALPAHLEEPFARVASGDDSAPPPALIRLGLAVEGARAPRREPIPPQASHLEDAPFARHSTAAVLDVAWALIKARHAVRRRPFSELVARLAAREVRDVSPGAGLLAATDQFLAARSLAPIAPVCLQDSVALIAYLARRGFHPTLVFGVCLEPFSAHCWVQAADVVLNDALLRARSHTPILAV